eukprot:10085238-Alexandrium_andersonii.AAC.1
MAREGGGWREEEECEEPSGYRDDRGKWQPYNSGEYQQAIKPKGGQRWEGQRMGAGEAEEGQ